MLANRTRSCDVKSDTRHPKRKVDRLRGDLPSQDLQAKPRLSNSLEIRPQDLPRTPRLLRQAETLIMFDHYRASLGAYVNGWVGEAVPTN